MTTPTSPGDSSSEPAPAVVDQDGATDLVRHVIFRLANERFAVPLEAVREVVLPQPPFARVPRAADAVRGAMNLRGRVIAIVDLASLVGLPPQRLEAGVGHVLMLEQAKKALGFLTGGVLGVEPTSKTEGGAEGVVRGIAYANGARVTVLVAGALVSEAERLFGSR